MRLILAALVLIAIDSPLKAEVVLEYDEETKLFSKGMENFDVKDAQQGLCMVAGGDDAMGKVFKHDLFHALCPFPLRYAVKGQSGRSVTIQPMPRDQWEGPEWLMVIMEEGTATALVVDGPYEIDVLSHANDCAFMDQAGKGREEFLGYIRKYVNDCKEAGNLPRAVVVVRSSTTHGELIDTWKLIQSVGCPHGTMWMSNELPSMKIDARSEPSGDGTVGEKQADPGYILIIIRGDGTYATEGFTILPDAGSVQDWIAMRKREQQAKGLEPCLFIRQHREALPKWVDVVLNQAEAAGVSKVVYSYTKD